MERLLILDCSCMLFFFFFWRLFFWGGVLFILFYWGSAKNTVFRYHTKSRDVILEGPDSDAPTRKVI